MRIRQDVTAIATFCTDKHQLPAYGLSLNIIGAKLGITTYEHFINSPENTISQTIMDTENIC